MKMASIAFTWLGPNWGTELKEKLVKFLVEERCVVAVEHNPFITTEYSEEGRDLEPIQAVDGFGFENNT
jgi:hypothetical protein